MLALSAVQHDLLAEYISETFQDTFLARKYLSGISVFRNILKTKEDISSDLRAVFLY